MSSKVGIIMPVKNVAPYIEDCLQSIQNQSFADWELIMVNDHSTDQTVDLIKVFQASDSRIQLVTNQGHGIIPALHLAISNCQGEYLTRFDGDDIMPNGRLAAMVNALDNSPRKTIVTGNVKYFGTEPVSKGYQAYETWLNDRIDRQDHWNWIYRECVLASPNWMMRRQELLDINPFKTMIYPEDYD